MSTFAETWHQWRQRRAEQRQWANVNDFAGLRELTARWCLGELSWSGVGQPAPRDPETVPIGEALAAINRAGLLTTFSEPAWVSPDGSTGQHAQVWGFATPETEEHLRHLLAGTRLQMTSEMYPKDLGLEIFGVTNHLYDQISEMPQIRVWDPQRRPSDLLWRRLSAPDWENPPALTDEDRAPADAVPSDAEVDRLDDEMEAAFHERDLLELGDDAAADVAEERAAYLHNLYSAACRAQQAESERRRDINVARYARDDYVIPMITTSEGWERVLETARQRQAAGDPMAEFFVRQAERNIKVWRARELNAAAQAPMGPWSAAAQRSETDPWPNCHHCGAPMHAGPRLYVSYDEGDGSAMVDTHCPTCQIESYYAWAMSDEEYEREFGHPFGEIPEGDDDYDEAEYETDHGHGRPDDTAIRHVHGAIQDARAAFPPERAQQIATDLLEALEADPALAVEKADEVYEVADKAYEDEFWAGRDWPTPEPEQDAAPPETSAPRDTTSTEQGAAQVNAIDWIRDYYGMFFSWLFDWGQDKPTHASPGQTITRKRARNITANVDAKLTQKQNKQAPPQQRVEPPQEPDTRPAPEPQDLDALTKPVRTAPPPPRSNTTFQRPPATKLNVWVKHDRDWCSCEGNGHTTRCEAARARRRLDAASSFLPPPGRGGNRGGATEPVQPNQP
ncbi:MAG: hypothetical protein JOY78_14440 [Pseudonocardia sp.]|nr:hypothetical protein [Pseudonocardia sp.]